MARASKAKTAKVAERYFAAVAARDVEAIVACWAPGGVDDLIGQARLVAPDGVRAYFTDLFAAFPDFAMEVVGTTVEADRCAVRWHATGTFAGPGSFQGFAPNGARIAIDGCDVVCVDGDLVVHNDAYVDAAMAARQLGALPPQGSAVERRMAKAFNVRTRLVARMAAGKPERVADGVWLVRGGLPLPQKTMNVYLIEDDGGVTMFDAGVVAMTKPLGAITARMGGLVRIVLGHAHADHRGAAAGLRAPVLCSALEADDVRGDGGAHYFHLDRLGAHGKLLLGRLLPAWDGGPVEVAGTLSEGEDVAGFSVIDLPGHAPGQIGLWRESDRLALSTDCFYTLDPQTGIKGRPRVPLDAFNADTEQARASIRKLAALAPAAAWPGHAEPLTGDVRAALERAAETT